MRQIDLPLLKGYMKVSHDDDDQLIETFWKSAGEYLAKGGIPDDGSSLYWTAAAGLTLYWYDGAPVGTDDNISVGLRTIINQMKLDYGGDAYF